MAPHLSVTDPKIPFLPESEIPKPREEIAPQSIVPTPSGAHIDSSTGAILDPPPHQQNPQGHFTGPGRTLGSAPGNSSSIPSSSQPQAGSSRPGSSQQTPFSEEAIKALTDLGVTRAEAIQYLELAGGNVDVAASMLFQG